jgi:hypothetical protein
MNGRQYDWIPRVLSIPKFEPYLRAAGGDVDAAIELYWSTCAALPQNAQRHLGTP